MIEEKKFLKPDIQIIEFDSNDIILTSGEGDYDEGPDTEIL